MENKARRRLGMFGRAGAVALVVGLGVSGLLAVTSKEEPALGATEKVKLEQCANIGPTCDTTHDAQWQNGNLNSSQAKFLEGDSVPFRSVLTGLTPGATYALTMEWESTKDGKHAYDYLTSYDASEALADICAGITCSGSAAQLGIPADPNVTGAGVTPMAGQKFTLFGGEFVAAGANVPNSGNLCGGATCAIPSNPSQYSLINSYSGTSQTRLSVYVTAASTSMVLGWGGHIATRLDWGVDNSAVSIPGSPYHMNMHDFTCSDDTNCGVGSMDRSVDADAVVYSSSITIIKKATPESSKEFSFTASPAPLENFSLIDDGTSKDRKVFSGITNFTTYTVSEVLASGWDFGGASCVIAAPFGGSYSVSGRTITINLAEGELVTCTMSNTEGTTTTSTSTTTTTIAESSTTTVPETTTTAPESTTTVASTSTVPASTTTLPAESTTTSTPGLPVILPGTGGRGFDWVSLGGLLLMIAGALASLAASPWNRIRGQRGRG